MVPMRTIMLLVLMVVTLMLRKAMLKIIVMLLMVIIMLIVGSIVLVVAMQELPVRPVLHAVLVLQVDGQRHLVHRAMRTHGSLCIGQSAFQYLSLSHCAGIKDLQSSPDKCCMRICYLCSDLKASRISLALRI